MSIAQSMLAEFEAQVPATRKFIERLPQDKLTWQPHPRSRTAGQLALHIAGVPGFIIRAAKDDSMQLPEGNATQPATVAEILDAFDASVATVKEVLPGIDDSAMHANWSMMSGDQAVLTLPREAFIRNILLNHWYQHRGQFGVYLRLLDVPVPATWGPSADEPPPFMQQS